MTLSLTVSWSERISNEAIRNSCHIFRLSKPTMIWTRPLYTEPKSNQNRPGTISIRKLTYPTRTVKNLAGYRFRNFAFVRCTALQWKLNWVDTCRKLSANYKSWVAVTSDIIEADLFLLKRVAAIKKCQYENNGVRTPKFFAYILADIVLNRTAGPT